LFFATEYHLGLRGANGFFVVTGEAVFPGLQTTDALFAWTKISLQASLCATHPVGATTVPA
jgi:hypothetical protein